MENNNTSKKNKSGNWLAIGISLGCSFGVILHNIPVCLAIGIAIGAALESTNSNNKEKSK